MGKKKKVIAPVVPAEGEPKHNGAKPADVVTETTVDFKANRELMRRLFAADLERAQEEFYRRHPDLRPIIHDRQRDMSTASGDTVSHLSERDVNQSPTESKVKKRPSQTLPGPTVVEPEPNGLRAASPATERPIDHDAMIEMLRQLLADDYRQALAEFNRRHPHLRLTRS